MKKFPVTPLGVITMIISAFLLGYSQYIQIPMGSFLGVIGFILPLVFVVGGLIHRSQFEETSFRLEHPSRVKAGQDIPIKGHYAVYPPLFFRLRVALSYEVRNGDDLISRGRDSWIIGRGDTAHNISSSVSGRLHIRIRYYWVDMLGFTSSLLEPKGDSEVSILCQSMDNKVFNIDHLSDSSQTQQTRKRDELEKIYTRAYVPGDLVRDINWKAYQKFQQLITRIPPESLGESTKLTIYYRPPLKDWGALSMVHLQWSKNFLMNFIREQRRKDPHVAMDIYLGHQFLEISSEDEIDDLEKAVAQISFTKSEHQLPQPGTSGVSLIFTSALDGALSAMLRRTGTDHVYLYRTVHSTSQIPKMDNQGLSLIRQWKGQVYFNQQSLIDGIPKRELDISSL